MCKFFSFFIAINCIQSFEAKLLVSTIIQASVGCIESDLLTECTYVCNLTMAILVSELNWAKYFLFFKCSNTILFFAKNLYAHKKCQKGGVNPSNLLWMMDWKNWLYRRVGKEVLFIMLDKKSEWQLKIVKPTRSILVVVYSTKSYYYY